MRGRTESIRTAQRGSDTTWGRARQSRGPSLRIRMYATTITPPNADGLKMRGVRGSNFNQIIKRAREATGSGPTKSQPNLCPTTAPPSEHIA